MDPTAYHGVWCPQYRHGVLRGEVASTLAAWLDGACREHGGPVMTQEIEPDPVHRFLSLPPRSAVAEAVKIIQGVSARRLFVRFPGLRKRFGGETLGSPYYSGGSSGKVRAETIRHDR